MDNRPSRIANEPLKTTLFEKEPTGTTYRIPALIHLKNSNTFLAFAEKRKSASDNDAENLVLRRGTIHGGSIQWSPTKDLPASLPNHRTMNPCPVYEKNSKTLFLFFICVYGNTSECWQIFTGKNKARLCYVSSLDEGESWTQVTDLTESVTGESTKNWATFAVGPGHGIQMNSGRLIVPAYAYYIHSTCIHIPNPFAVCPYALSIYSDDFGKTWKIGKMLEIKSLECEMAEIVNHEGRSHLYCNARNTGGYRVEALSATGGFDFDKPRLAQKLVETGRGCQGSVVGFPSQANMQTWILYSHPTSASKRKDLGVYLNCSPEDPSGWGNPWIINKGPSGYSDLAYSDNTKNFACLMECGNESEHEQIAFVSFTLTDVMQATDKRDG